MPARVVNIAPCITQVTFKQVHCALLINQLRFGLTFFKVLANFPTVKAPGRLVGNDVTRVVIPFKDQDSANIVKARLKELSIKLQTTIQPVFVSRKIGQDLRECETKPQLINQQCVVYLFKRNLYDTGSYVDYTRGHLYARVDGHKSTSSSVRKHYDNDHAVAVPEDLLSCLKVLKKCMNKFDCLAENETSGDYIACFCLSMKMIMIMIMIIIMRMIMIMITIMIIIMIMIMIVIVIVIMIMIVIVIMIMIMIMIVIVIMIMRMIMIMITWIVP